MRVKCISPRLKHVAFGTDGNGAKKPYKVGVGDTFSVKSIPDSWRGLVVAADPAPAPAAATNPASGAQGNPEQEELDALRAEYMEQEGKSAPKNWGVRKLKAVLSGEEE